MKSPTPKELPQVAASAPLDELAEHIGEMLVLFGELGNNQSLRLLHAAKLSMSQMIALFVLERHLEQSVSQLATMLKLSRAATSHMIERLVRLGYVERQESVVDRRRKLVSLSDKGRALLDRLQLARRKQFVEVLRILDPKVVRRFEEVVSELVTHLREHSRPHANRSPRTDCPKHSP
ncbi:MAG: MarR family transcriptional regulator [Myxococcota bacterium]|nr:MarR family transcriptional regulator [Myxococcota bacterium]